MTSVAVVNAYRRFSGSTIAAQSYYAALQGGGYHADWYQCVDTKDLSGYVPWETIVRGVTTPVEGVNLALNRLYFFARRLRGLPQDLVLATDQVLAGLADRHRNCLILVHDLRELDKGTRTHLPANLLYRYLLPKLRKAQGLLAISEVSKRSIEAHLSDLPPIKVVHHGTMVKGDPGGHLQTSLRRLSERRTLNVVYVAVDRPYKRVDFFLELAREMERRSSSSGVSYRFLLLSRITPSTQANLARAPVRSLEVRTEVEDLAAVWQEADILAFPSTMEGFGRPMIEAMQFGIPVLAHAMEPMREVVQEGGLLLPPLDLKAWADALQAMSDPEHLSRWSRRSATRGAWFSQEQFTSRLVRTLHEFGY